jgi:hypothetical protein
MPRKKSPHKTAPPAHAGSTSTCNRSVIISISSRNQKMEAHHPPEVEKKGFKEYLLEELRIFLAVFMDFIAENIREDYTEYILNSRRL